MPLDWVLSTTIKSSVGHWQLESDFRSATHDVYGDSALNAVKESLHDIPAVWQRDLGGRGIGHYLLNNRAIAAPISLRNCKYCVIDLNTIFVHDLYCDLLWRRSSQLLHQGRIVEGEGEKY
jgi:hypothetical protein